MLISLKYIAYFSTFFFFFFSCFYKIGTFYITPTNNPITLPFNLLAHSKYTFTFYNVADLCKLNSNLHSSFSNESSLLPPAEHATNYPPLPLERHAPPPPTNLLYADQYMTPAHASRLPGTGASGQVPPLCFDNSPDARTGGQVDRSVDASVHKRSGHGPSGATLWQSSTHHSFVEMPAEQQVRPDPFQLHHHIQPSRLSPAPRLTLVIRIPLLCLHRVRGRQRRILQLST